MSPSARPPARAACVAAAGVLVAVIAVLSFHAGGYYEEPRAIAGVVVWGVVAALAIFASRELLGVPRAGLVALAGLAGLTAWTAIAKSWAPLADPAGDDVERLVVYFGGFAASLAALSAPAARRWLPTALVLVAVVVVGYGLAERFLPGVFDFDESAAAAGRLEQPLTYWNAMGALGAIGLVLAVHAVASPAARWLRPAAAAAMPLLALGIYLSFSRGALLAAAVGAAVLLILAPRRPYAAATGLAAVGGLVVALLAARFPAFERLAPGGDPERDGLVMLALAVAACAASAVAAARLARRRPEGESPEPSTLRMRAVAAVVAVVVVFPVIGAPLGLEAGDAPDRGAGASRISSVGSSRYAYWRVALESVPDQPLKGIGPGAFPVLWMKERPIDEAARDVHSLQLETVAELGLPGLAFLGLLAGGVLWAGGAALRRSDQALGVAAGLAAWAATISVDWIWEMPALALIGLMLAAALIWESEDPQVFEAAD